MYVKHRSGCNTLAINSEFTILWCLIYDSVSIFKTINTGVFIEPRTVTKFRTLGQIRHRSVANPVNDYSAAYFAS